MQFLSVILFIAITVFILYYLPLIAKDLHKNTKQNEEIKVLLERLINKHDEK